ncbi:UvrD-helicase-domain-containing protein [Polyplosphaeria fusca]|uniref:DNA 3'-5' helicase n=1 Tax=Polyplosphaeria fusca TaxID=682080 RepID=A0A9P4QXL2_9PLEO|nr:UvrD-helicase-domain-containing protein [Polyplosphaeria fusca]
MDAILDGLNPAQRDAVTSPAHVLQVLAPPGSGKTKTLTARVAYLISHEHLQPWNIVVCTFTIKAAREMRERIRGMIGDGLESKLIIGTFHSICRRFLVRYGQEIGIPKNFGIADTSDSSAIIKRIVNRLQSTIEPGVARSRISNLKSKGITAEHFAATIKQTTEHEFANLYSTYEETLAASNLLDYDDLLLRCTELLRKHPLCVSSIQAVLVDEYQDTNNVQYDLMSLVAQAKKRITIVGDPDQSIYSFRSAEIKNLHRMRADYPESVVINLDKNYRSSGCILISAIAVIEQDESRPNKPLVPTHAVGEQPTLRHLATSRVEAQWIVGEIKRSSTLSAGLLNLSDYAILLRTASLSLSIEKAFGDAGIPYRMVGGKKFFDRAEIKILLDYLRVINQPDHNDALVRVINVPSRNIGDVTFKGLLEEAEKKKITLWTLILNFAQGRTRPQTKISTAAQKGIDTFVNLILTSRKKLFPGEEEECNLIDLIGHVLQKVEYEKYLKKVHKENWRERWANVEELVAQTTQTASTDDEDPDDALPMVEGIEQRKDTAADRLSKFLRNVALSTEADRADGELNQVTISTIHAAKGLEWPVVFIPGVYDGSIPHSRAEDHDEERRLLYVGMTRAQMLRRPVPNETAVAAAQSLLERIEDDQYPLTREEIDGEEVSLDPNVGRSKQSFNSASGAGSFKRRKLDPLSGNSRTPVPIRMNQSHTHTIAATTMQKANPGFTSATVQHKILQEAQAIAQLYNDQSVKKRTSSGQEKRNEPKGARGNNPKPRPAGQGSIMSFFGRSTSNSSNTTDDEPTVSSHSQSAQESALTDISNVHAQPTRPYQPPLLSSHRPRNAPVGTRPKRPSPEPDVDGRKYVLLSSSPVKQTSSPPRPQLEDQEGRDEPTSPTQPRSEAPLVSGFRPVSTFHSTSVGSLQNRGPPKRALGMRRSMQGWQVKHNGPPRPQP